MYNIYIYMQICIWEIWMILPMLKWAPKISMRWLILGESLLDLWFIGVKRYSIRVYTQHLKGCHIFQQSNSVLSFEDEGRRGWLPTKRAVGIQLHGSWDDKQFCSTTCSARKVANTRDFVKFGIKPGSDDLFCTTTTKCRELLFTHVS